MLLYINLVNFCVCKGKVTKFRHWTRPTGFHPTFFHMDNKLNLILLILIILLLHARQYNFSKYIIKMYAPVYLQYCEEGLQSPSGSQYEVENVSVNWLQLIIAQ
jgi:hypothetical protein